MNKSEPLVSIVMPVFNGANCIDETIHSVLGQTYDNFELIIVDDASTDNTLDVVDQFKNDKIKVIRSKRNCGAVRATNRGIRAARGEYLAFIDANDRWQPGKLKQQIEFMSENKAAFSFASYVFADKNGRPNGRVVRAPASIDFAKNKVIMTSTVMLNMNGLNRSGVKMEQGDKKWQRMFDETERAYGMHEVMAIRGYDLKVPIWKKVWRRV